MIIYLMRHGIAEDFDPATMRGDADRKLTKEGKDKMAEQARGVKALELGVELLIASPYQRARQTADYVAQALGKSVEHSEALVPHADPDTVLELLAARNTNTDVMLFGHEPHLSSLGALILTGRQDAMIEMKKGSLLAFELPHLRPPYRGVLKALYPPRALRLIS